MTYIRKRWGFQVSYDRLHDGRLRPCALVWVCRGTVEATRYQYGVHGLALCFWWPFLQRFTVRPHEVPTPGV